MKKPYKHLLIIVALLIAGCSNTTDPEETDPWKGVKFQYMYEIQDGYTATISYFDHEENHIYHEDAEGQHFSEEFPARTGISATMIATKPADEPREVTIKLLIDGHTEISVTDSLRRGGNALSFVYDFN